MVELGKKDNKYKSKLKKVITPYEKLKKRIHKEFSKKKYIGDINISDEEYKILIQHAFVTFKRITTAYNHIIIEPMFATALVQIGIKNYDGNYWTNFAHVLNISNLTGNQQYWVGESFISTLKKYEKVSLGDSERVNNILMHGFVSDNYSIRFFDFLFRYYNIDLERDIEKLDSESIKSLVEVMIKNDNRDRTALLVHQTADALKVNTRGSKIRIRRWLKLIDKCFWDGVTPNNIANRFNKYFVDWKENSVDFNREYKVYGGGNSSNRVKLYSYPYIKCNFAQNTFQIVLPKQLVKKEDSDNVYWQLSLGNEIFEIEADLFEAVTGYKTDIIEIDLSKDYLFDEINIELKNNNKRIMKFKIERDCVRFFNSDGIYIKTDILSEGKTYSYSKSKIITDAIIEYQNVGDFIFSYFEFQNGDIIKLPDDTPISIGKKMEEGLLRRGLIDNVYGLDNQEKLIVYNKMPGILIKLKESKINGSMLNINKKSYKLSNIESNILDLNDRSGEVGLLIRLSSLAESTDGIYEVCIDVPNDRTNRLWKFILINNLTFRFDDSPYIFKKKGTITFINEVKVNPINNSIIKINEENSFAFPIDPSKFVLEFNINFFAICFKVPVFRYRFDNGEWQIEKPSEIWHSKFPKNISIIFPSDSIVLKMDNNDFEAEIEQSAQYKFVKEKGYIDCDVIRFNSWFGRNELLRNIYIDLDDKNKNIGFIEVITKSTVVSKMITCDTLKDLLIGKFEIAGNSNYYIDIEFNGKIIADKYELINGIIELNTKLNSGVYQISVYEDEEDDTGFGGQAYLLIEKFFTELVNPYDLQGKSLTIKAIKKGQNSIFKMGLSKKYSIQDLKRISDDDYHNYSGKLMINGFKNENIVNVRFQDIKSLNYCYISFYDEYEEEAEFLYDDYNKTIEFFELDGLKYSERYRRYETLFEDDYNYNIEFINSNRDKLNIKKTLIRNQRKITEETAITKD